MFQFNSETWKELERTLEGRKLVVACDGANGQTTRYLGLNDEYIQHSCRWVAFVFLSNISKTSQWLLAYCYGQLPGTIKLSNDGLG